MEGLKFMLHVRKADAEQELDYVLGRTTSFQVLFHEARLSKPSALYSRVCTLLREERCRKNYLALKIEVIEELIIGINAMMGEDAAAGNQAAAPAENALEVPHQEPVARIPTPVPADLPANQWQGVRRRAVGRIYARPLPSSSSD